MLQQRQWRLVYYHPRHRVLLVVKGYKYLVQSHLLHHHPFTSTITTPILWFANQTESTRLPAKPFRCPGCVVVGNVTTISWHDHHEHYKIMPWNEDNHGFCCCHRNLIMKLEWGGGGGRIVLIPRPPSSSLSYDESTFRNSFQLESNPYYVGIVSYVSTFHQARLFAFFLGTADWAPLTFGHWEQLGLQYFHTFTGTGGKAHFP